MEVHSHGLNTLGANKDADKVYNPELRDIVAPSSGQTLPGENFAAHPPFAADYGRVNDEPPKNIVVDSNPTLNSAFSFPRATPDLTPGPDISFQPFDSVETGQDLQHQINQVSEQDEAQLFDSVKTGQDPQNEIDEVPEQGEAQPLDSVKTGQDPQLEIDQVPEQDEAFDDMVILENDVVKSATVAGGAGHTLDGFQTVDAQMEAFQQPLESDIHKASSVAADSAVQDDTINVITSGILDALPADATVTLTSNVTVLTTVTHDVTIVDSKKTVIVEASADLPQSVENESPPAPTSEFVGVKLHDAMDDLVKSNIAVDAQRIGPPVSDEDILAIVGQKVVKKFGRKNFPGEVTAFDPETNWFKVIYEDGDDEDLELLEVKEILGTTKKRRHLVEENADEESSGKTAKKARKTGSTSTAKKSNRSGSGVKSPKTPVRKAKVSKSSRKSTSTRNAKSIGKSLKKALNPSALKTPANSEVKEEKGKRKAETVTPKGNKGSSAKKRNVTVSRNLNLPSPKAQGSGKAKANAESFSSKSKKKSGLKSKVAMGETSTGRKGSRKAAPDSGGDTDLVGKQIRKDFDGSWYDGVVLKFDKKTQFYKVKYTDGDQEDLELHELEPILVESVSNTDEKDDKPPKLSSLSSLMSAHNITAKRK